MQGEARRNVVWLGTVSFLADIAGEMIVPLLPLFITATLGAPAYAVGLVDGGAELSASLFRAVGGWFSDRSGRRKPTVIFGYSLSAAAKPMLALSGGWLGVAAARAVDRAGKGLRGSARDALIASSVDPKEWGRAFGLHRAMDTAGAVLGPLIALILVQRGVSTRAIFAGAGIPAAAAVVALAFVRERTAAEVPAAKVPAGAPALPPAFWKFLGIYGLFALGNSSDSFILLKAKLSGMSAAAVIGAYILYNLVNAASAPAVGRVADRVGRRRVVATGFAVYAICYAGFASAGPRALWPLFALYGFHAALVEGAFRAIVSGFATDRGRGSAHGIFQGSIGVLSFASSALAGLLWMKAGPAAPFWLGSACAAMASGLLFAAIRAG